MIPIKQITIAEMNKHIAEMEIEKHKARCLLCGSYDHRTGNCPGGN